MARGTWGGLTDPNLFKVNVRFMLGTSHCQTGFKVRDVAIQDNTPETVANTVVPWANDHFRTALFTVDTLEAVDVVKIGTDEGFTHSFANVHGTLAGDPPTLVPSFMAANIAMKSEIRKRYGQGRMFWPVRNELWVETETLGAPGIAAYQSILDALTTLFTGDPVTHDLILVNAHGTLPPRAATPGRPARPEIPPSWYDVTSARLITLLTPLKSRKQGVGT